MLIILWTCWGWIFTLIQDDPPDKPSQLSEMDDQPLIKRSNRPLSKSTTVLGHRKVGYLKP